MVRRRRIGHGDARWQYAWVELMTWGVQRAQRPAGRGRAGAARGARRHVHAGHVRRVRRADRRRGQLGDELVRSGRRGTARAGRQRVADRSARAVRASGRPCASSTWSTSRTCAGSPTARSRGIPKTARSASSSSGARTGRCGSRSRRSRVRRAAAGGCSTPCCACSRSCTRAVPALAQRSDPRGRAGLGPTAETAVGAGVAAKARNGLHSKLERASGTCQVVSNCEIAAVAASSPLAKSSMTRMALVSRNSDAVYAPVATATNGMPAESAASPSFGRVADDDGVMAGEGVARAGGQVVAGGLLVAEVGVLPVERFEVVAGGEQLVPRAVGSVAGEQGVGPAEGGERVDRVGGALARLARVAARLVLVERQRSRCTSTSPTSAVSWPFTSRIAASSWPSVMPCGFGHALGRCRPGREPDRLEVERLRPGGCCRSACRRCPRGCRCSRPHCPNSRQRDRTGGVRRRSQRWRTIGGCHPAPCAPPPPRSHAVRPATCSSASSHHSTGCCSGSRAARLKLSAPMIPSLMLFTTGAKSGLRRETPLMCFPEPDGSWYIAGSNFGLEQHPAWSANLIAHPEAEIHYRRELIPVTAHDCWIPTRPKRSGRGSSSSGRGTATTSAPPSAASACSISCRRAT